MEALIYGLRPIAAIDAVSNTPPDTVESKSPKLLPSKSCLIASAGIPATGIAANSLYTNRIIRENTIFFLISSVPKIRFRVSIYLFIVVEVTL